jgi:hypothetical protein
MDVVDMLIMMEELEMTLEKVIMVYPGIHQEELRQRIKNLTQDHVRSSLHFI